MIGYGVESFNLFLQYVRKWMLHNVGQVVVMLWMFGGQLENEPMMGQVGLLFEEIARI